MTSETDASSRRPASPLDQLVVELHRRRAEAGHPSYAEIAARVESARRAAGVGDFEARLSRSTVYDLFRYGRRRIDIELFREVLASLGAEPGELEAWRATAVAALAASTGGATSRVAAPPELPRIGTGARLRPLARRAALLVLLGCLIVNLAGNLLTRLLPIDLYLDMIGTAVVAILVGPWSGALVGVLTDGGEVFTSGTWHAVWFGLANAVGALVWGYGVRRGLGRTILRYVALNVIVALCVSVVATVVLMTVYDGYTGHASDSLARSLVSRGHSLLVSVFSTNLITSIQDKLVAGFVALVVAESVAVRQGAESTRLPLGS